MMHAAPVQMQYQGYVSPNMSIATGNLGYHYGPAADAHLYGPNFAYYAPLPHSNYQTDISSQRQYSNHSQSSSSNTTINAAVCSQHTQANSSKVDETLVPKKPRQIDLSTKEFPELR